MKKQTRIGIIRDAIKAEGGKPPQRSGIDYYADGPNSSCTSPSRCVAGEVVYKVPKDVDNLTVKQRLRVVEALKAHPAVKDAYLSRKYRSVYMSPRNRKGGHIKVIFQN